MLTRSTASRADVRSCAASSANSAIRASTSLKPASTPATFAISAFRLVISAASRSSRLRTAAACSATHCVDSVLSTGPLLPSVRAASCWARLLAHFVPLKSARVALIAFSNSSTRLAVFPSDSLRWVASRATFAVRSARPAATARTVFFWLDSLP